MRKIQLAISILLLFVLTTNCSDKNSTEPSKNKIKFDGITSRDTEANPTGLYDSTDWRLDDSWQSIEKELFSDYELHDYSCAADPNIRIIGYPNPSVGYIFRLEFPKDSTTRVDFRLVNQNFEKIFSRDSIYSNGIALTFRHLVTENDSMFRMYYRFVTENNCCYIGHGDILVK